MNSRFDCPSTVLQLRSLLKKGRKILFVAVILALSIHLSFTQISGLKSEKRVPKPLTTKFVKRVPRLTKPLEMKKRPRSKMRRIQRKMVAVKAKVDRRKTSSRIQPTRLLQNLAMPEASMIRKVSVDQVAATEPAAMAEEIVGQKEVQNTVDMPLEMMDIDALDTGQYQAMVIQDPNDKRNLKDFLRLAIVYPLTMRDLNLSNSDGRVRVGIIRLVRYLNVHTGIKASVGKGVTFDDRELMKTPWVRERCILGSVFTSTYGFS